MSKAVWILILLLLGFVGFRFIKQWNDEQTEKSNQPAKPVPRTAGGDLAGLPAQLESGYRSAKDHGSRAFQTWFKANETLMADPRKAWIELELCVAMARDNPAEAKIIYASIKSRVPPSSPVYSRVKELERTFQ